MGKYIDIVKSRLSMPAVGGLLVAALLIAGGIHLASVRADSGSDNAASNSVENVWPTEGSALNGNTSFIADVAGVPNSDYDMFWFVDGGSWNWMDNTAGNTKTKHADLNVSGWHWKEPTNDYTISFVAVMHGTNARIFKSVSIHVGDPVADKTVASTVAQAQTTTVAASTPSAANAAVGTQVKSSQAADNLQMQLYTNPNNSAARAAAGTSDPTARRVLSRIGQQATATWFGDWNSNLTSDVNGLVSAAAAAKQLPVLVAYDIPERDCGSYSGGGASSNAAYLSWIQNMANGIGSNPAMVLLEPDAVAQSSCLSAGDAANRSSLLSSAISILKADPRASVYLDAGNPSWIGANDMAGRLRKAGISAADGFSLNVSNFETTQSNLSYGKQISDLISNKHFVIDTSRNGNGANGEWCNPSGRALGQAPSLNTGQSLADAYLWVKGPGESDGSCNGGPAAGNWWQNYAVNLGLDAGW